MLNNNYFSELIYHCKGGCFFMGHIKVTKKNTKVLTDAERKYRQEASRKVSMANKRLQRMENQNLKMSPAYKKWVEDGGQKFGIKGKSNNEVKAEVARLNKFLNQTTSTVKGTKKYLTNVANQVGVKQWDSFEDLGNQLQGFFDVSDKVQEYLRNSKEVSVSIGYKKVWEEVNEYAESMGEEFSLLDKDVAEIAENVVQANAVNRLDNLMNSFIKKFIDENL